MKVTASNIAWQATDDTKMYEFFKNNYIHGIEIAPTRIFENNPYDNQAAIIEYKNNLKQNYQLEVVSMQSICFGKNEAIFNTEIERNDLKNYIYKAIIFAEKLNCKNLVFGCPKNRVIGENQEQLAINYFTAIGNFAAKHQTTFAFEPNPVIYGTNFINTTEQAFDLIKNCNTPGLKVNLDLGTIIYNQEDLQIIEENCHLINHVHISEPYLEFVTAKNIHLDLAKILKKCQFKNYVSVEMKSGLPIEIIQETIKYIQDVFEN